MTSDTPPSNIVYLDEWRSGIIHPSPADEPKQFRLFTGFPIVAGLLGIVVGLGIGALPYL